MQRVLIMVVVVFLVVGALAAGSLAANWPFWQRAWQWQTAASGWPASLAGPRVDIAPGSPAALQFQDDAAVAAVAAAADTQLLLVAGSGPVRSFFRSGFAPHTPVDGRGLAAGLVAPVVGALIARGQVTTLDLPVGVQLKEWVDDPRGRITLRQLLWNLSGLAADRFVPLNPASRRAQLASGPDFHRAVTHTDLAYPPGSHFDEAPVNAQAVALWLARQSGRRYAALLQEALWSQIGAHPASGLLDHRRGNLAAHCCMVAAAEDWLRLGKLLANNGHLGHEQVLATGFVTQMMVASPVHPDYGLGYAVLRGEQGEPVLALGSAGRLLLASPRTGHALLWIGEGAAPQELAKLLAAANGAAADPRP
jgi:CubicO group peptidase (beta-lactamase class C family)